jgi:hypothetical protein
MPNIKDLKGIGIGDSVLSSHGPGPSAPNFCRVKPVTDDARTSV